MESFTFDRRAAVTVHERHQKDEHGGWIWGNSVLTSNEQKHSLQDVVWEWKAASTCNMEDLPG